MNPVLQTQRGSNLDDFLNDVVDDEEHEDDFARQDEIVLGSNIAQKFDGT